MFGIPKLSFGSHKLSKIEKKLGPRNFFWAPNVISDPKLTGDP